jgi:hypothetical protein
VGQRSSAGVINTKIGTVFSTSFEIKCLNYSTGANAGAPTNDFRFYFSRNGVFQVPNNRLNVGNSNIWFAGFFE